LTAEQDPTSTGPSHSAASAIHFVGVHPVRDL
jgi:hypothetical protein